MTADKNKDITSISYNHLNLPVTITFTSNRNITYIYDATGVKLKKVITQSSTSTNTEYAGGIIYENGVLEMIPQPEGYIEKNGSGFDYVYQYKDHLGNIRLSYKNTSTTGINLEIQEENNYYPFGLEHKGYGVGFDSPQLADHPYKYNGKEFNEELGLDWYDYGARNYDPALGRWMNVDPLAHKMPAWSPYSFVFNNPLSFIDPDGRIPTPVQGAKLANHIYGGKVGDVVAGWTMIDVYINDKNSGYRAGLYSRTVDGVTEYVMANAGTEFNMSQSGRDDLSENIEQPVGGSEHMKLSISKATEISNELGESELTFVGHSKGGAEAAGNALATNRNALLYNPAAINAKAYGLDSKFYTGADDNGMNAYIVKGDAINTFVNSWLAKQIDKATYLPKQSSNPITNHSMGAVIKALEQYLNSEQK
jgi:RHS repeat-associated protein